MAGERLKRPTCRSIRRRTLLTWPTIHHTVHSMTKCSGAAAMCLHTRESTMVGAKPRKAGVNDPVVCASDDVNGGGRDGDRVRGSGRRFVWNRRPKTRWSSSLAYTTIRGERFDGDGARTRETSTMKSQR